VTGGPGGARLAYGEPVTGLRRLEVLSDEPPLTDPAAWRVAGRRGHAAPRLDVVTGARRYGSDLQLPGMLHGTVLHPPSPGCTLRSADTGQAAALPGVTVVREEQFIGLTAPDPATARQAVAAIGAEWDKPPAGPADMTGYLREHPTAGQGWERKVDRSAGETDAALAAAAVTVQHRPARQDAHLSPPSCC